MAGNSGGSESGGYKVGYGRPPAWTRFRKGMSGNPSGKAKGTRNRPRPESDKLRELVRREAYRPVKIKVDGNEITVPLAQAALRSLGTSALKGETRALAIFLKMLHAGAAETDALLEELRDEAPEPEGPPVEFRIVDVVDGRPVPSDDVYYPYGGGPPNTKV